LLDFQANQPTQQKIKIKIKNQIQHRFLEAKSAESGRAEERETEGGRGEHWGERKNADEDTSELAKWVYVRRRDFKAEI